MSELFDNPVLIEVTAAQGSAVEFTATHRKIVTRRRTDYDNVQLSIAEHLAVVSRRADGDPVGAVVFNAAIPDEGPRGMDPLGFMVGTETGMRDADDEDYEVRELSQQQEAHWTAEHMKWKRTHKFPRRRVLESAPPAPVEPAEAPDETWEDAPAVYSESEGVFTPQMIENAMSDLGPEDEPAERAKPRRVSDLDSLMEPGKHSQVAQYGWQGALNRIGLLVPPGKDERVRRDRERSILAGWDGTKNVVIVDEKGSTGKTPTAMETASVLSRFGRGSVILRDGNPTGNAHERGEFFRPLGSHPPRDGETVGKPFNDRDLARQFMESGPLDGPMMERFLHRHTADRYGLLSTFESEDEDDEMEMDEVDASYKGLAPHASAIVTDTGNSPFDRRDRMVLRRADQLIVPFLTLPDRENGARKTLIRLENRDEHSEWLVRNGIAVIHMAGGNRFHRGEARRYEQRWTGLVRHIVVVPYDPHMHSTSLRFDGLRPATQSAFLEIGAAVAEGFRAA